MNAPAFQPADEKVIGAILIDSGKLKAEDAEQVLRLQREKGMRFGDAAVDLGLITAEDLRFALARQYDYPVLQRGSSKVSDTIVSAYTPASPQVEALRAIRSQLMLRWFGTDEERKTLAIVSPDSEDGRSWLVANLAVVFSQLGERTLIIDADMRSPVQHELFGLTNQTGLSTILGGRGSPDAVQRVPELMDLSVLTSGPIPPNPQELLARPMLTQFLQNLTQSFDVIIIDTPAGGKYADGEMLAVRASGALVVARKNKSSMRTLRKHVATIKSSSAFVVGTVLNSH